MSSDSLKLPLPLWFEQQELIYLGTVTLDCEAEFKRYYSWIDKKKHGQMSYLEKNLSLRQNPKALLLDANCAIIFGMSYYQGQATGKTPKISQYAKLKDYHKVMRKKAQEVVEKIASHLSPTQINTRILVDTAPVLERALAAKSPSGFIGKNTCFIDRKRGSFLFLGEILTNLALEIEEEVLEGECNTCVRCQVACPTGALNEDYTLDATKCLAYWSIEHRGTIPYEFWNGFKEFVFGCDICQSVCPFNELSVPPTLPKALKVREVPNLFEMATMNASQYEKWFGGTPMTRAKRTGLRRNALISMTMLKTPLLEKALELALMEEDPVLKQTVFMIKNYLNQNVTISKDLRTTL